MRQYVITQVVNAWLVELLHGNQRLHYAFAEFDQAIEFVKNHNGQQQIIMENGTTELKVE